jgi:hypothetical protein
MAGKTSFICGRRGSKAARGENGETLVPPFLLTPGSDQRPASGRPRRSRRAIQPDDLATNLSLNPQSFCISNYSVLGQDGEKEK